MSDRREWDPDDLAASWVSPPGLGTCIGVGSGIGIGVAFVGIALTSVLSGLEWQSAVGFGAFVAFWGGLGFGSMMGGVAYVMGLEKAANEAEARAPSSGAGEAIVGSADRVPGAASSRWDG